MNVPSRCTIQERQNYKTLWMRMGYGGFTLLNVRAPSRQLICSSSASLWDKSGGVRDKTARIELTKGYDCKALVSVGVLGEVGVVVGSSHPHSHGHAPRGTPRSTPARG